jgi:hypothetical protein
MGGDVSINPQINETLYRKFCKHERRAYWRGIPFPEQRRKREAAPILATQPAEAQIPKPDGSDAHRTCDAQRTTSPLAAEALFTRTDRAHAATKQSATATAGEWRSACALSARTSRAVAAVRE